MQENPSEQKAKVNPAEKDILARHPATEAIYVLKSGEDSLARATHLLQTTAQRGEINEAARGNLKALELRYKLQAAVFKRGGIDKKLAEQFVGSAYEGNQEGFRQQVAALQQENGYSSRNGVLDGNLVDFLINNRELNFTPDKQQILAGLKAHKDEYMAQKEKSKGPDLSSHNS